MLKDWELISALPLTRCELTDKLLHLSSSVESKGAKLDIFLRFLPALKFSLCPTLMNKSRDSLQYENAGSIGGNGEGASELEPDSGALEASMWKTGRGKGCCLIPRKLPRWIPGSGSHSWFHPRAHVKIGAVGFFGAWPWVEPFIILWFSQEYRHQEKE